MHVAYVDDSGRDKARTITGLVLPAHGWNEFLHCWLEAREKLTATWGVRKHAELHGIDLARGRGSYCASDEEELTFRRRSVRLRAYDLMLAALAQCENLVVTTVCTNSAHLPTAYRKFVEHLQHWAASVDSHVLIMLDGQGHPVANESITVDALTTKISNAYRDASPTNGCTATSICGPDA